ncbi:MAG: hypothetical protein LVQ95_00565 [Candidatus Micrarchaeales archaeon]|nr:hypothetical protein [Candidatus Micrarchaeales archaeon]
MYRRYAVFLSIAFAALALLGTQAAHTHFSQYSDNWAGYIWVPADSGYSGYIAGLNATFTVPRVSHSNLSVNESVGVWIGVDGYSNENLIQTGIAGDDANGQTYYYAWYELLPQNATLINITVSPGDTMFAQITLLNATSYLWNIDIVDITNGQSFSTNVTYYTPLASAEYVVEAPALNNSILTLAPFTTVEFNSANMYLCSYSGGCFYYPVGAVSPHILFVNQSGNAASPSVITPGNESFYVTYTGVPPTPVHAFISLENYTQNVLSGHSAAVSTQLNTSTAPIADALVVFSTSNQTLGHAITNKSGIAVLYYNGSLLLRNMPQSGIAAITAAYTGNQTYTNATSAPIFVHVTNLAPASTTTIAQSPIPAAPNNSTFNMFVEVAVVIVAVVTVLYLGSKAILKNEALRIAKDRYAKGEISKKEYEDTETEIRK